MLNGVKRYFGYSDNRSNVNLALGIATGLASVTFFSLAHLTKIRQIDVETAATREKILALLS